MTKSFVGVQGAVFQKSPPARRRQRHPLLVLAWSFGLFVLVYSTQYLYMWVGSRLSGIGFIALARGEFVVPQAVQVRGLSSLIIGIPIALLAVKFLWKRDKKHMCSTFNLKLAVLGTLLGILLSIIVLAILSLVGTVKIVGTPDRFALFEINYILVGYFGFILFMAMLQEFVFRGMVLREWAARWGWLTAAVLTGLYSGAARLLVTFPSITLPDFLGTVLLSAAAGLLFAAMYIRSKSLWLAIGFHMGWNFCLKAIFGTITGGIGSNLGIFETLLSGPELLTGGPFGLEFSVISIIVYLILAVLFLKFSLKGKPTLLSTG